MPFPHHLSMVVYLFTRCSLSRKICPENKILRGRYSAREMRSVASDCKQVRLLGESNAITSSSVLEIGLNLHKEHKHIYFNPHTHQSHLSPITCRLTRTNATKFCISQTEVIPAGWLYCSSQRKKKHTFKSLFRASSIHFKDNEGLNKNLKVRKKRKNLHLVILILRLA